MSLWWDIVYWLKKTPWDTGVTPPEIVAMIESGKVPIGARQRSRSGLRHRHERDLSRAKRFCGNGRRHLGSRDLTGEAQGPIGAANRSGAVGTR